MLQEGEAEEIGTLKVNRYLLDEGVVAVKPSEVAGLIEEGFTLLDVRIDWSHGEWHLEKSTHIPLSRKIEGSSPIKAARKAGFALFAEFPPVERNYPTWLQEVQAKYTQDSKLIIACDQGGLLSEDRQKVVYSSSLEALFLLKKAGFRHVYLLQ
eukprot:gene11051-13070_t